MTKDAEIEQGFSLSEEKWQRKKLRLPHSQKREAEKPQKREAESPLCLRITDDSARANLTFMGAKQRFVGANAKNMGANAAIVTFAPTIPCLL